VDDFTGFQLLDINTWNTFLGPEYEYRIII
jgi:hypothetical protein